VLSAFLLNVSVAPLTMLMVVQLKMPFAGMFNVVLLVMFIGPYEPSLPELKVWAREVEAATRAMAIRSRMVGCMIWFFIDLLV
jgi:hypothetical protein